MQVAVFLDTPYVLALAAVNDQYHRKALELSEQAAQAQRRALTTHAVVLEVGNALSKNRYRSVARGIFQYLTKDPRIELVPVDSALMARGIQLFEARPDKEWGLVD